MHLASDFQVIVLPPGQSVQMDKLHVELRPDKLYVLPTGAKDDTPSFAFLAQVPTQNMCVVMQISRSMLAEGLMRAGLKVDLTPFERGGIL
jgi:hypothetical protein